MATPPSVGTFLSLPSAKNPIHRPSGEKNGYGRDESLTSEDLLKERYRGIRPAPGYPACPDHTEKRTLFSLLDAEKNAGIRSPRTAR